MAYFFLNAELISEKMIALGVKCDKESLTLDEAQDIIKTYAMMCHVIVDLKLLEEFEMDQTRMDNLNDNWDKHRNACLERLKMYTCLGSQLVLIKVDS